MNHGEETEVLRKHERREEVEDFGELTQGVGVTNTTTRITSD